MAYDTIKSELVALREAVKEDDQERLNDALTRLTDEYKSVRTDETSRVARLQAARTEADLTPEQHKTISTYERWFMTTYFGRGSILTAGDLYLLDPDESDPDELYDQVTELIEREDGLQSVTSETASVLQGVNLPPRIGVLSFETVVDSPSLGDDIQISLALENVGDDDATGVEAELSSKELGIARDTNFGTIEEGDTVTTTFDVTAASGGTVKLEVAVTSENAGTVTETETLTIRTKASIVENVLETLENLKRRVRESEAKKGTKRSVTAKIDAALESLHRALDEIDKNREKQANNAIKTCTNQLGALLNVLAAGDNQEKDTNRNGKGKSHEKGNGNTFELALQTALINRTELAIDHLVDARGVPIEQ